MDIKNDHRYAINLNVRGIQPSATLRINELSNQLRSEGKDIIKLGLGQSPFPVPDQGARPRKGLSAGQRSEGPA